MYTRQNTQLECVVSSISLRREIFPIVKPCISSRTSQDLNTLFHGKNIIMSVFLKSRGVFPAPHSSLQNTTIFRSESKGKSLRPPPTECTHAQRHGRTSWITANALSSKEVYMYQSTRTQYYRYSVFEFYGTDSLQI